jgi:hypothetical protein
MIEKLKKIFEFPVLDVVKFDVKTIIAATPESDWTDEEDWGGGEV